MTRNSPEKERECGDTRGNENGNPDRATKEQFLHIWLANRECTKRRRLGLAKEYEYGVKLVLVRYEEENRKCKGYKKLCMTIKTSARETRL